MLKLITKLRIFFEDRKNVPKTFVKCTIFSKDYNSVGVHVTILLSFSIKIQINFQIIKVY